MARKEIDPNKGNLRGMKTNWTQEEKRLMENGLGEQMARDFIGWSLGYAKVAQREGLDYDAVISAFYAALDEKAGPEEESEE